MTGLSSLDGIFKDSNFFNPDATFTENLANLGNDILGRVLAGVSSLITGEKINISSILTDGQIDLDKASLGLRQAITPILQAAFGDHVVLDENAAVNLKETISNVKNSVIDGLNNFLYNIYKDIA